MKKVWIIAYYFPPMGMGGVQRALKFAKYLKQFGWQPVIFTVKETVYYGLDPTLLEEIPDVHVIRTGSLDPIRLQYLFRRKKNVSSPQNMAPAGPSLSQKINQKLMPWFFLPDTKVLWLPFLKRALIRRLKTERPDAILTTSPPQSAHLAGKWLAQKTGIPWIADFRDNWPGDSQPQYPTPFHRWADQQIRNHCLTKADHILSVSEPILKDLTDAVQKKASACHCVKNGYDPQDFECASYERDNKFSITYCGTLNKAARPDVFLEAVRQAILQIPELKNDLEFRIVGSVVGMDLSSMVSSSELEDVVQLIGYVSHRESISRLKQSTMLLLIISHTAGEGMVTGKLFEYLASGKPVLALSPHCTASRLILKYERGSVLPPDRPDLAAAEIIRAYSSWKRGDFGLPDIDPNQLRMFSRITQTEKLANILNLAIDQDN